MKETGTFNYADERFADLQMLRYRLPQFEKLSLQQKKYIYYLSQATLCGRDITTDQFGKYNLRIRKTLETLYTELDASADKDNYDKLALYLKRVWFSNGIYHHYANDKIQPDFSEAFFRAAVKQIPIDKLPMTGYNSVEELCDELCPVMFNPEILPKRVNKADGVDLVRTSACNYYEGVSQQEVEDFYNEKKAAAGDNSPSWGLNTKLVKGDNGLEEKVWKENGEYGEAIRHIICWLDKAKSVAENQQQQRVIDLLIKYYRTGDLHLFDEYSIEWLKEQAGNVDFINGFIEVYGDPLGIKASWEGIVEYKDLEATRRTRLISDNAQWFEDHSPIDSRFKKAEVRGVTANVVCAAMLGGDEYPTTAIGINLPNADWIRAQHGSKSVTISNITDAYNKAAKGNGFKEEFVIDEDTLDIVSRYGDICDDLHTDLHECLGHGSGQLLPGVSPDALKAYGNTIEEARADLFGLYYMADDKLQELGLLPDKNAFRSLYYTYMMNGLMTQLTRIERGKDIEEAHMRNRALIAHWTLEHGKGAVELVKRNGKTYVQINNYEQLRRLFGELLAEVQRIKSEGDFNAARNLVENYAVKVDDKLHAEVLERFTKLDIAPYKGFINPVYKPILNSEDEIIDVEVDYSEAYDTQMLRYSSEFGFLV
ncbi:dihydrofolate reductase [Prevotella sp. HMSC073D09]|uniref:dipeptidyl-peptidase 3 family protein n=1 Tax=Prevotella sp. HMSC073D09 TaxID=1739459 RepID=UPI0008A1846B|nr:dihydrofolate reductase [Prevotella sp. HMSC073D09]OFQ09440.1 dihydrofolate reductase [Prevotella sp. HMSC073D09]